MLVLRKKIYDVKGSGLSLQCLRRALRIAFFISMGQGGDSLH